MAQSLLAATYALEAPAEFFAVTCEAYFVSRERFATEFPALMPLYDGFFKARTGPPRISA